MKIALGSTSESKKEILKIVLSSLILKHFEIEGVDVNSGIVDQPLSEETTIQGAINRAKHAFEMSKKTDFSIGLEGGLSEIIDKGYFLVCVAAIYDGEYLYLGVGGKLQLPSEVTKRIKSGEQFGTVIREYEVVHKDDSNVLPLVKELITREESFKQAISNAFFAYKNKKHYSA